MVISLLNSLFHPFQQIEVYNITDVLKQYYIKCLNYKLIHYVKPINDIISKLMNNNIVKVTLYTRKFETKYDKWCKIDILDNSFLNKDATQCVYLNEKYLISHMFTFINKTKYEHEMVIFANKGIIVIVSFSKYLEILNKHKHEMTIGLQFSKLRDTINTLQQQVEALTIENKMLKQQHEQDITKLKQQHEQDIAKLKQQHEQDIAKLKQQHEQDITKLKQQCDEAKHKCELLYSTGLKQKKCIDKLDKECKQLKSENTDLRLQFETALRINDYTKQNAIRMREAVNEEFVRKEEYEKLKNKHEVQTNFNKLYHKAVELVDAQHTEIDLKSEINNAYKELSTKN